MRIRVMADANTRALRGVDPARQTRRAAGDASPLMETMMQRSAAGELRWALTLFPTQAYAAEADMSLADYEDFFYRACLVRPSTTRSRPGSSQSDETRAARRLDHRARRRSTSQGPGTDLTLNVSGRTFVAGRRARTTCPTASSSPGPSRTRSTARSRFSYPGRLRRPRGRRREAALRGRPGRRRLGRAQRGVPDPDARHRRRRAPPRRARHRHQLRDRPLHQGDPARREDRRHDPPRGRHVLSRDRRVNNSAVHWDMVCDLRKAAGSRSTARSCRSTASSSV